MKTVVVLFTRDRWRLSGPRPRPIIAPTERSPTIEAPADSRHDQEVRP